jgi:serine/threonine protein kinase
MYARAAFNDFGRAKCGVTASAVGIGDFLYMSPEIYEGVGYTNKINVFSFGLIAYEILEEVSVFPAAVGAPSVMKKALTGKRAPFNKIKESLARDIIERCSAVEPDRRPT